MAEHAIGRVHVLAEIEVVAEVALHPLAASRLILSHQILTVEPASRSLVAALELRPLFQRLRIVELRVQGLREIVAVGPLPLQLGRSGEWLSPQQDVVRVVVAVVPELGRELVLPRLDRALPRERVVEYPGFSI